MKCRFCGRDNPDGATFCECGRPLANYGAPEQKVPVHDENSPFAYQTLDSVKVKTRRRLPVAPLIVLLAVLIGVGIFLLIRYLDEKKITDEGSWEKYDRSMYSITVPNNFKEKELEGSNSGSSTILDYYTSRCAALKVQIRLYTTPEKEKYGNITDAKTFAEKQEIRTLKINGEKVPYKPREEGNYIYVEYETREEDCVGKSEDLWMIEAMYPGETEYYLVNAYCDIKDKEQYRDSMFKWLDSFKGK